MKAPDGGETGRVASIKIAVMQFHMVYDKRGYVTSATNGSTAWKYHYDASGQLLRKKKSGTAEDFLSISMMRAAIC